VIAMPADRRRTEKQSTMTGEGQIIQRAPQMRSKLLDVRSHVGRVKRIAVAQWAVEPIEIVSHQSASLREGKVLRVANPRDHRGIGR
jgi:hypothetical protein